MEDLPGYGLGYRHIQAALVFTMVVVGHIMCFEIPTVIVAITDPGTSSNPNIPSFPQWTDQSLILVSYYWGNAPALLLGGPLSRKYGTKWFMVLSIAVASLVSLATPSCIEAFGSVGFMVCYFILGICQGLVLPMLSEFISKWVPLPEVTTIGTWIFAGISLGAVIATELAGALSSSWYGWPSVFYVSASMGSIWCILMLIFGHSNPDQHKCITMNELEYINRGKHLTKKRIPWSNIVKSPPVWANWIAQVSLVWTARLCGSELPTYINRVLGLTVVSSSRILASIYFLGYLHTFVFSGLSHYLIKKEYLSVCATRKLCNSIASWGSAFNLILLGTFNFSTTTSLLIILSLVVCILAGYSGFNINYNDLSPNYSGSLLGIGGVAATVVSFLPVTLVQFMVTNQTNPAQWGNVFWLAALVTGTGNIIFVWKGEANIQEWDAFEGPVDRESYMNLDNETPIQSENTELGKTM